MSEHNLNTQAAMFETLNEDDQAFVKPKFKPDHENMLRNIKIGLACIVLIGLTCLIVFLSIKVSTVF